MALVSRLLLPAALIGGSAALALPHAGGPPRPPMPTIQPPSLPPPMVHPVRRGDSEAALDQMREGRIRSLHEIESRVVPRMPGASYLGPEFDPGSGTYRLKFMRGGSVIWVDVDARTGAIVGRSGD